MRLFWILGVALLAAMSGRAGECTVTVVLSNAPAVSQAELVQAKCVARAIFAGIGVSLSWGGKAGGCETRVGIRLEQVAGPGERPDSLAYATLGAEGERRIHVFVDRVHAMVGQYASGSLLGHVLAHEIAHVLEGTPQHADRGVMKAHWERNDLKALLRSPLRFEQSDDELIHAGLARGLSREPSKTGD
jgi:hypothetical protein